MKSNIRKSIPVAGPTFYIIYHTTYQNPPLNAIFEVRVNTYGVRVERYGVGVNAYGVQVDRYGIRVIAYGVSVEGMECECVIILGNCHDTDNLMLNDFQSASCKTNFVKTPKS